MVTEPIRGIHVRGVGDAESPAEVGWFLVCLVELLVLVALVAWRLA